MSAREQAVEAGVSAPEGWVRALLNALPDLVFVLDEEGLYVEVFTGEENLLYSAALQLKGRRLHEVLPPADADRFLEVVRRTIETQKPQSIEYLLSVQAGTRWFEGRTAPLAEAPGEKRKVVWVSRDITASKQAEEGVRLNLVLQRVRSEILQMQKEDDWEKVVLYFWRDMKELVEFDQCSIDFVDLQQQRFFIYGVAEGKVVQKEWIERMPLSLSEAVTTGKPVYRHNQEEIGRYGDLVDAQVRSIVDVPFPGGTVAVNSTREDAFNERDIQILERFAQVMGEAHRRLEDLKALAAREEQLQQVHKLEAISQLATGVAHEINNPLTSVVGYSELLLRGELSPQVREFVETIHREGWRAQEIAEWLLRFSRRQRADKQWLALNPLVEETLALVRHPFELDHVQLLEELAADLPLVEAHPGQFQQVVLGLIQNSREAILRAGKRGVIEVRTALQEGWVRLEVEDDGPGIPEGLRGRIFEPFFTTKDRGKGTGLGLSLCHAIAAEHGGRLFAAPRQGGACLVLELPTGMPQEEAPKRKEGSTDEN